MNTLRRIWFVWVESKTCVNRVIFVFRATNLFTTEMSRRLKSTWNDSFPIPMTCAYEKLEELWNTKSSIEKMNRTMISFLNPLRRRLNHSLNLWPHQEEIFIFEITKFVQPWVIGSEVNCSFPVQRGWLVINSLCVVSSQTQSSVKAEVSTPESVRVRTTRLCLHKSKRYQQYCGSHQSLAQFHQEQSCFFSETWVTSYRVPLLEQVTRHTLQRRFLDAMFQERWFSPWTIEYLWNHYHGRPTLAPMKRLVQGGITPKPHWPVWWLNLRGYVQ